MPRFLINEFSNFLLYMLGAFLIALGLVAFFIPGELVPGGPPGMSIMAQLKLGWSAGLVLIVINASIMLAGWRFLGTSILLRSLIAVPAISIFTQLLASVMPEQGVTDAMTLNCLYGGLILGLGIGLMLAGNASSGGWSLLCTMLSRVTGLHVSYWLFILDALVIAFYGVVFEDIERALWSGISILVVTAAVKGVVAAAAALRGVSSTPVRERRYHFPHLAKEDKQIVEAVLKRKNRVREAQVRFA